MAGKGTKLEDPMAAFNQDDEVARWLAQFPEVRNLGLVVYTPEGLGLFLRSPQPRFGGRSAIELMADGQAERVLAALAADHEGLGS